MHSQTQKFSWLHSFCFCNVQSPLVWLPRAWGRIWAGNNSTRFKLEKCKPIIWGKINSKLAIQRVWAFGTCKRKKAGSNLTGTAERELEKSLQCDSTEEHRPCHLELFRCWGPSHIHRSQSRISPFTPGYALSVVMTVVFISERISLKSYDKGSL